MDVRESVCVFVSNFEAAGQFSILLGAWFMPSTSHISVFSSHYINPQDARDTSTVYVYFGVMNRDAATLPDISCTNTQLPLLRIMKMARPKKAEFFEIRVLTKTLLDQLWV